MPRTLDSDEPKTCPRCKETKTRGEFPRDKSRPDGRYSWCKACNSANVRARYDGKQHAAWCKEHLKTDRGKAVARAARLRFLYNLTPEQYEEMKHRQQGVCAICGNEQPLLHIDHCHDTGVVRGLLCVSCNHGLGHFADNADRLMSAAAYLLQHVEVVRAD